ncbi:MAG: Re/Si-specific NAD(P)(+) transhydrogenase subunit alpha [Pseudomonadota bacterium]
MQLTVVKECRKGEHRVAASPDSVKKLLQMGFNVTIETGAGTAANIPDKLFKEAGADIAKSGKAALENADVYLTLNPPSKEQLKALKKGAVLIGMLEARSPKNDLATYAKLGINALSLDLMPRITRAQSMDVLSSQSNLAGYRSVIEAAGVYGGSFAMMMTAAGTVAPAKILILGAGVAGLQAIATAKRLGAIVSAFDVRPTVKEQVESLGATFMEVEGATESETSGGYAKETSKDYQKRQAARIHEVLKTQDIAITTALIPGKPAPILITDAMIKDMKPGAVIVDMAASMGGNVALSKADETVEVHNITIIAPTDLASHIASDASSLYARNLLNFVKILVDEPSGAVNLEKDDEITQSTLAVYQGKITLK